MKREKEEIYVKTRAWEWIAHTTGQEFDKKESLEDLIQNGAILKRIADIIQGKRLEKRISKEDLQMSPISAKRFISLEKVNDFLLVCKEVGLKDQDLFVASDVINKKNTMKVCLTIRALAMKCQKTNIKVPMFSTGKQEKEARQAFMSKHAVGTKVKSYNDSSKSTECISHHKGKLRKSLWTFAATAVIFILAGSLTERKRSYKIQHGDTLTEVARKTNQKISKLLKKNQIKNPDLIFSGDPLIV